jgi:hypothetical protein
MEQDEPSDGTDFTDGDVVILAIDTVDDPVSFGS